MTEPSLTAMQADGFRPGAMPKARPALSDRASADSTEKSIKDAISTLDPIRRASVQERMPEMPKNGRGGYFRAVCGRASPGQAIKAFCMECACWQRAEAGRCTSLACPLYAYCPQQKERMQDATAAGLERSFG